MIARPLPPALLRTMGLAFSLSATPSLHALRTSDLHLPANMQVELLAPTAPAERFRDVFRQGKAHLRLRTNLFWWDWENEQTAGSAQTRDHQAGGIGGSLLLRSARFQGWSGTAGFYSSVPVHREHRAATAPSLNFGRAGKDTYRTRPDGTEAPLFVVAQAFAEYRAPDATLRLGRQIIDSLLLASNDTKMVPNTFEAARLEWRPRSQTTVAAAFLRRQKLRDRSAFHTVIAYRPLLGNDDSGSHRGLTPPNLAAGGVDPEPPLFQLSAEDRSFPQLKLQLDAVGMADLLSTVVIDATYELPAAAGWTIRPGLRGLRQWDRGAGAIGGAALNGAFARDRTFTSAPDDQLRLASYRNPHRLDSSLWAARLAFGRGPFTLTLATSRVADAGDIVNPWRGFPTGGYTRAMGQLDWFAGAANQLARIEYDFRPNRVTSTLTLAASVSEMDLDDRKIRAGTVAYTDRRVLILEATASFRSLPRTAFRLRSGFIDADAKPLAAPAINYESYRDVRLELNRFF